MSQPSHDLPDIGFGNRIDVDQIDYAKVSPKSLLSAALGLGSLLALLSPLFWVIPVIGIALSLAALSEVRRRERPLIGRAAARIGLALALLFGTAGVTRQVTHRWWIERDAQQFGQLWFRLLSEDQPQKAYQLNLHPGSQQPLDSDLWDYYRTAPKAGSGLKKFVEDRLIHTLLALKDNATVRYWSTTQYNRLEGPLMAPAHERIGQTYAVTYADAGRTTTFFARLDMDRIVDQETREALWQIVGYEGGVRPETGG